MKIMKIINKNNNQYNNNQYNNNPYYNQLNQLMN